MPTTSMWCRCHCHHDHHPRTMFQHESNKAADLRVKILLHVGTFDVVIGDSRTAEEGGPQTARRSQSTEAVSNLLLQSCLRVFAGIESAMKCDEATVLHACFANCFAASCSPCLSHTWLKKELQLQPEGA